MAVVVVVVVVVVFVVGEVVGVDVVVDIVGANVVVFVVVIVAVVVVVVVVAVILIFPVDVNHLTSWSVVEPHSLFFFVRSVYSLNTSTDTFSNQITNQKFYENGLKNANSIIKN